MPFPSPRAKRASRAKTPAEAPAKTESGGRRSLGELAKLDMSELLGAVHLPRLSPRQPRQPRPGRSGGRQVVGLDIEPGYITAAQVAVNGGIAVERAAGVELAPEIVRDGEVIDVVGLSEALKTLFAENKLDPRVRLGIANQRIVVRTLELPPIEDHAELATAVRFQAQDELPMSLDSAVIDIQALGIVETPSGPRQRVVLVAARREMVERLLVAAREAGLRPEGIDLSAFALIRSLHVPGSPSDERVVYLSLGGLGNLAVAEGSVCQFTRVLSIGLESIAGEVAERLGVSVGDARALLMRGGFEDSAPQIPQIGAGGPQASDAQISDTVAIGPDDPASPEATVHETAGADEYAADAPVATRDDVASVVGGLLSEGVRRIGVEIRNSLHYHAIHGGDQAAARVLASGAMTQIPGFVAALANELELDVELAVVHELRPGAFGDVPGERLAVATGLAVSEGPA
jgi:type IV pilus assembly protein PilM